MVTLIEVPLPKDSSKKWPKKSKVNWKALSAGINPTHGPCAVAVEVAEDLGVDLSGHTPVRLDKNLLRNVDLVLTMEEGQRDRLKREYQQFAEKINSMREYLDETGDVQNPHHKSRKFHKRIFLQLRDLIEKLVDKLEKAEYSP